VLWSRTKTTLGEVTLTAIAERVLHNASEHFPFVCQLTGEASGGGQFRDLDAQAGAVDGAELIAGIRFVLTEFLTVLGNLTAEILTPVLHAALSNVALADSARGDGRTTNGSGGRRETESQGKGP
jgi:hypothetical protein